MNEVEHRFLCAIRHVDQPSVPWTRLYRQVTLGGHPFVLPLTTNNKALEDH